MKPDNNQGDVPLRELWTIAVRQRWIVALTVAGGVSLALIAAALTAPEWRSFTRLQVEGRTPAFPGGAGPDVLALLSSTNPIDDIPTQLEVLQSDRILLDSCAAQGITPVITDPSTPPDPHITAHEVGFTSVVELTVDSHKKEQPKLVAEQIPVTFRAFLQDKMQEQVTGAIRYLDGSIADQQAKVDKLSAALRSYREAHQVTGSENDAADRAGRVSHALQGVHDAQAGVAATQNNLEGLIAARDAMPQMVPEVTTATLADQRSHLQGVISDAVGQRAQALVRFTEDSDIVKDLDGRIADARKQLNNLAINQTTTAMVTNQRRYEMDSQIATAKGGVKASLANLAARQQELSEAYRDLGSFNTDQGEHMRLMRELNDETNILTQRFKTREEFIIRKNSIKTPITVTTPATPPIQTKPNYFLYVAAGAIIGILGSIPLIRLKEKREDKLRSIGEAYEIAGALPMGHIPAMGRGGSSLAKVDPSTARFDNFRVLRSNLLVAMAEQGIKSVMITSTGRREGKTDLTYNLAVAMAIDGKKVLLVDANLRQSSLHTKLGLSESPGLADILNTTRPLAVNDAWIKTLGSKIQECTHPSEADGLHIITAGAPVQAPVETLSVATMKEFHDIVHEKYDLVLFDSASFVTPADPQALARVVDGVLFVVNVGATKRAPMRYSMDLLRQAKAKVLGIVINNTVATGTALPEHYKHAV